MVTQNRFTNRQQRATVDEMMINGGMVVIPSAFEHLMGVPDEGTRIYRAQGNHAQMRRWFDALCQHIGPCISPGGAAVYAKVSRAAVYKRIKAGGLTAFCFHITGKTRTLFGNEKKLKELPLVYIPVEECKAWGVDLDRRAARVDANRGTAEDESASEQAEHDKENPSADFVNFDSKDKTSSNVRYVEEDAPRSALEKE